MLHGSGGDTWAAYTGYRLQDTRATLHKLNEMAQNTGMTEEVCFSTSHTQKYLLFLTLTFFFSAKSCAIRVLRENGAMA